jgi:hypothetical protein
MTLRQKIGTFLEKKVMRPYCDECIRAEIGETDIAAVAEFRKAMRDDPAFLTGDEICTRCGQGHPTIMAVPISISRA